MLPADRARLIVALGDSTTAGTPGFKSPVEAPPEGEGDESSQFAYLLTCLHPGWRVLNHGVNGERSDQIAARYDRDVLAHRPDVVIVIAGVNDVYQGLTADHVIAQLQGIYDRARAAGIRVVAGTIVPYNTATSAQNAVMHEINTWIATAAAGDVCIVWADTRAAVADPADPDRLASSPDELHPDVDGYKRMADALAPAIEEVLRD